MPHCNDTAAQRGEKKLNTVKAYFCRGQEFTSSLQTARGIFFCSMFHLYPLTLSRSIHHMRIFYELFTECPTNMNSQKNILGSCFFQMQVHSSLSRPPLHPSLFGILRNAHKHLHATHIFTLSCSCYSTDWRVGIPAAWLGFPHLERSWWWWDFPQRKLQFSHCVMPSLPCRNLLKHYFFLAHVVSLFPSVPYEAHSVKRFLNMWSISSAVLKYSLAK